MQVSQRQVLGRKRPQLRFMLRFGNLWSWNVVLDYNTEHRRFYAEFPQNLTSSVERWVGRCTAYYGPWISAEAWSGSVKTRIEYSHAIRSIRHHEWQRLKDFFTRQCLGDLSILIIYREILPSYQLNIDLYTHLRIVKLERSQEVAAYVRRFLRASFFSRGFFEQ